MTVQALTEGGQSGPSECPSVERQEPRWSHHPPGPPHGPRPSISGCDLLLMSLHPSIYGRDLLLMALHPDICGRNLFLMALCLVLLLFLWT
jgi:hypothetical protein